MIKVGVSSTTSQRRRGPVSELSSASKRVVEITKMRKVPHEVSHRRNPDGKGYVGSCTCGFETKGNRVMDARLGLNRHLSDADPDQLERRLTDEMMKVFNRGLKKLATQEDRRGYTLDIVLYLINR